MYTRIIGFLFFLCFTFQSHALDVFVNNRLWKSHTAESLHDLCYSMNPENPLKKGITLDEVLPPMFDAYRLRAGNSVWAKDDLTGDFPRGYITEDGDNYTLTFEGRRADRLESIEVWGEIIENRTLDVWVSWEGVGLIKQEIERYAALHDAAIRVIEVPKTSSKLISVLRGGGSPPDLIMTQSSDIPGLVLSGALQHLDYLDTRSLDTRGTEAFTTKNKLWGIPFYCDPQVVFINRELVPDPPGYDWTLEDFEDLATGLARRGVIPAAWNAYSASWLIPFQSAFGKERLIEPDGSIVINDPASIEALEYILSLRDTGFLSVLERDAMVSLFVSGKVAMILSGSYSIPSFQDIDLDFTVLPFPFHGGNGRPVAPLLDYKAFSITRRTRHPVLARRLIEYLTGLGVQQRFPPSLSKLAVHRDGAALSAETNDYFSVLAESSSRGIPIPPEKAYGVYKNTMWSLLRFALTDRMTAEEVLDKGQEIIDTKLRP